MSTEVQNIVVVGGGYGAHVARDVAAKIDPSKYKVILINPLPYRIWLVASARNVVTAEGSIEKEAFLPYDRILPDEKKASLVIGTVTSIEKTEKTGGHVVLEDGQRIPFRILVLATGSKWDPILKFPNNRTEVETKLKESRSYFAKAKKVVVVGGGAVGVELSGEIKEHYPETDVTLIHAEEALLNKAYPLKFRKAMEESVTSKGIKVVLNEFVEQLPEFGQPGKTVTKSGKSFDADLVVATRGPKPNTDFIISSLGAEVATETGSIKVTPTLQLPAHSDIYALGDIIDWKEQKQAAKAGVHAGVVAANVLAVTQGNNPTTKYKGSVEIILVTNGKGGGRAYLDLLWGIVLGDWAARLAKSKSLLIPMYKGFMKY